MSRRRHSPPMPSLLAAALCGVAAATPAKPHIVFALVDDNGWAGVGYNNPHLQTPKLDALCASGLKLTSQYVYKYCSPTRTAIQSGRNPYHVVRAASAPPLFFLRSSFRCHGRTRSTPGRRSTTRRTR